MAANQPATKPFWESTTFWINAAGMAAVGLEMAKMVPGIQPEYVALIVAVLNIINRFRVAGPVKRLTLS